MRIANALLGIALLGFAALQRDRPDAQVWIALFLVAAVFPLLAVARRGPLARWRLLRGAAWLAIGVFLAGFLSLASAIGPDWPRVIEAREALGCLVAALATGFALLASSPRLGSWQGPALRS